MKLDEIVWKMNKYYQICLTHVTEDDSTSGGLGGDKSQEMGG